VFQGSRVRPVLRMGPPLVAAIGDGTLTVKISLF
jgi:hypothetical protein